MSEPRRKLNIAMLHNIEEHIAVWTFECKRTCSSE